MTANNFESTLYIEIMSTAFRFIKYIADSCYNFTEMIKQEKDRDKHMVSIIIYHSDSSKSVEKLLDKFTNHVEVIVIDDASEKPIDTLRKKYSKALFFKNPIFKGFAKSANLAVSFSHGEWLVFLDTGIEVSLEDIENFIHFAKNNTFDAVSPRLSTQKYFIPLLSFSESILSETILNKFVQLKSHQKSLQKECLCISANVFKEIGGWDERFSLHLEDHDLTRQLHQKGFSVGFCNDTVSFSPHHLDKESVFFKKSLLLSKKIYAKKYFSRSKLFILNLLSHNFSQGKTLPIFEEGATLVVPNVHIAVLEVFFKNNWPILGPGVKNGTLALVVVSSALSPKNVWDFRFRYPEVKFIHLEKNHGFASTVNIGLRTAMKNWVGTINDDTIMVKNWVVKSLKSVDTRIGSINPVIVGQDGKIESAGIQIDPIGKALPLKYVPKETITFTDATNGAAVLYNHVALEKIDLFDERFGSYLEDIDLSLRLSRAGFKNAVSSEAGIIHKKHLTSKSMGRYKKWLDARNWWYVILKNWPLRWWKKYYYEILLERARNIWGIFK